MVDGIEEDWKNCLISKAPQLQASSNGELEDNVQIRKGTILSAIAHIITAVIGAGVLSLAWSMAQLGWIVGPIAIIICGAITLIQSNLLADCYKTPNPKHGPIINHTYRDAVLLFLGHNSYVISIILQHISLFGSGVAYVITSANSMRAIKKSNCYHKEGHQASCSYGVDIFMLMFGAVQVFVSQIPDFHNMAWLWILAAITSFCYAFIGLGLGLAKVIENGTIKGGIRGISMAPAQKTWRISQALGDIAFAYPFSVVLLEIEDTLKSPPSENQTMKKASTISIFITTLFYLGCGCFGYAAFGNDTPGNILTGFGFYEPYWLIDFANACIILHLVGGYQVFSQPVFSLFDRWLAGRFPASAFVNKFYNVKLPFLPTYRLSLCRLCYRTLYVATTTGIAVFFPYFNQVLGVLGSFNFWPLSIYFPVEMYIVQKKIRAWTTKWVVLQMFSIGCLLVSIFAFIGSIEGLISEKLS